MGGLNGGRGARDGGEGHVVERASRPAYADRAGLDRVRSQTGSSEGRAGEGVYKLVGRCRGQVQGWLT